MQFEESKQQLIELFQQMIRIRYFEEEVFQSVKKGLFHGTTHLCIGQEATAVGVCSVLSEGDKITSTHRGHGHAIAMGVDMDRIMAEIFGKKTGCCQGKGGSMHLSDINLGHLGSNGIVGGGIPIAVGAALTAQLNERAEVTVCFFGDGATNEGSFHEALNLASIWQLPVVFVCENNEYGMSSSITEMIHIKDLATRAASYGFLGVTIDGNQLLDVIEAADKAVQRARNGEGPTFIEAKTYRFSGHSKSDKQLYRTKEEVMRQGKRDPIRCFEQYLIRTGQMTEEASFKIKEAIQKEVEHATTFALESKNPCLEELLEDVYA